MLTPIINIRFFLYFSWIFLPSLVWSFALHSPSLCIDSLLLPIIERGKTRRTRAVLRILWALFFIASLLLTWNIHPSSYEFYLIQTLAFSPLNIIGSIALLITTFSLLIILTIKETPSLKLSKLLFFSGFFLIILKTFLVFNIINYDVLKHILKSPTLMITKEFSNFAEIRSEKIDYSKPTPKETFMGYIKNQENTSPKIILMLVESWAENISTLNKMADDLNKNNITITKKGFTTFNGSTLQGELRELCSKYISLNKNLIVDNYKTNCAPEFLKNKGYEIIGLHGYTGNFYARNIIWSNFGIKKRYFEKDLSDLKYCNGSFFGICDKDLIIFGLNLLSGTNQQFLYILTLGSHEPIKKENLEESSKYFKNIDSAVDSQIIARKAISNLVDGILKKSEKSCTEVYIVGDHQPPSASGDGAFPYGKVPYFILSFNCNQH